MTENTNNNFGQNYSQNVEQAQETAQQAQYQQSDQAQSYQQQTQQPYQQQSDAGYGYEYGYQQSQAQETAQNPYYAQQGSYNYQQQPLYAVGNRSKIAAGLLGIFLGSLGIHNFYLGNTTKAVIQLLLTVVGWIIVIGPFIASVWGLIEGILILASKPGTQWHRDSQGYELQD